MFGQGIFRFPLTDASFTLLNRSWTNFRFGMLIIMAWLVWKQRLLQTMFQHLLQKFEMYLKYIQIHKKHLHLFDMSSNWMRKSSKRRNQEALQTYLVILQSIFICFFAISLKSSQTNTQLLFIFNLWHWILLGTA